jgi:beta-N-acetylhexosaminidase
VEYLPFRAAIQAGCRAVMTGHLLVPALDRELATISRQITTGVLRDQLGFTGTVVTDALEMAAVSATIGMVEGFVAALVAGADTIESGAQDYPELLTAIPDAVLAAVRSGRLPIERLAEAAERTALLASPAKPMPAESVDGVAARCLEVLGPLPRLVGPLLVECRPANGMASGPLPWTLVGRLHERLPRSEVLIADGPEPLAGLAGQLANRALVAVVRDPSRHPWQHRLLELAVQRHRAGAPTVLVDVGWPVFSAEPAGLPQVRTRGIAPGLLAAAAELLAPAVNPS